MTKVKICGITHVDDARCAAEAGADFLGFILYRKSRRYIAPEQIAGITQAIRDEFGKQTPRFVGVFVNETVARVRMTINVAGLDLAVLPIGDQFTMGPDDSLEAIKLLNPKRVAPCHYNTWPPIEQDAEAWAQKVKSETEAEPTVLNPGEKTML